MIEVDSLPVRFGGVTPLDDMTVIFPNGACGLIGPNGAGKTTFFNVLSGFVRPAAGTIRAFGEDLLSMADFRRARWGLRRSFQTEQAIEGLSVFENVAMIHEHTGGGRTSRRADVRGDRLRGDRGAGDAQGRRPRRRGAAGGGARARRRRQATRRAARRAGGRPPGRADRAPGPADQGHPRALRRARDPRRPRHEPRLGLLRDDLRARLRQADRDRPDGRRAAERARDPRLPRHGGEL